MNHLPDDLASTRADENNAGFELSSADLAELQQHALPSPAIDMQTLLDRCLGNEAFALLVLGEFQSSITRQLSEIARHAENADHSAMHDSAHTLKGTASTLAAEGLRRAAADLEAATVVNDAARISTLVERVRSITTLVERIHREAQRCQEEIARHRLGIQA